jgi:glyoxylase-like metal-dependent hydrolase (beta-lactamase superfamily II)
MPKRVAFLLLLSSASVGAQQAVPIDLTGEWTARSRHEDEVHRIPGPELGDYAGFPLNEAGKVRAESWDAAIMSQPEQQTRPHAAQYSMRGPFPNFRMQAVTDPVTNQIVAYTITNLFGNADRTIWMDRRPHPSPHAEHKWEGFSTGVWEGNALKVTTTHMKSGFLHRNGTVASPLSRMTEYFIRHDLNLLHVSIVEDPAYLEEPLVRTSNFVWAPNQTLPPRIPFEVVDEVAGMPASWVPSYPLGTRHEEFAKRFNLPLEATRGGAQTMYPEYMARIRQLRAGSATSTAPAAGRIVTAAPRAAARSLPVGDTVDVLRVNGNVYLLVAGGVNVTAQVGNDGILVVDTGPAAWSDRILAALQTLSNRPIRYIVNTSAAEDRIGGNAALAAAGLNLAAVNAPGNFGIASAAAPIVAHEQVLGRMSAPTGGASRHPFASWPNSTFFGAKKTLSLNGEGIELLHQPKAHSDGDSLVYFRGSDVVSAGHVYSTTSYPVIDLARGGSVQGVLDALTKILDLTIPEFNQQGGTLVVPARGSISNEADVVEYRNMVAIIRDRIQAMVKQGLSLEAVKAARPTIDYDALYAADSGPWTTDMFIDAVYRDVASRQ